MFLSRLFPSRFRSLINTVESKRWCSSVNDKGEILQLLKKSEVVEQQKTMVVEIYEKKMSTHLELIECPLCKETVRSYQEFMIYVEFHPIDEMKIDVAECSNNLSEPLPRSSESVQHVRTIRNKRANSQSPLTPPSFCPWVRDNYSDTNVLVNQQVPLLLPTSMVSPPPFSYDAHFIRSNDDGRGVHSNQQLPPPSSYRASLISGNNEGRDVHTNQLLLPPSYHSLSVRENDNNIGVQANQLQQMFQPTRRTYVQGLNSVVFDLNETPPEFQRPHIKEINFPILDRSDPSQLKFKPQLICDNETSEVDLSLKL